MVTQSEDQTISSIYSPWDATVGVIAVRFFFYSAYNDLPVIGTHTGGFGFLNKADFKKILFRAGTDTDASFGMQLDNLNKNQYGYTYTQNSR